jgi:hypothetical protein
VPRFWAPAFAVLAAGGVLTGLLLFLLVPRYRSETVILYREGLRSSYFGQDRREEETRSLALRLRELILARPRLKQLIDENGLYGEVVKKQGYVEATDQMRQRIAFRYREGDTFDLTFEAAEPAVAQRVTAQLAASLVEEVTRGRAVRAEEAKDFLESERKRNEEELANKERERVGFLTKHPEFALDAQDRGKAEKKGIGKVTADPMVLALEREAARLRKRLGAKSVPSQLLAAKAEAEAELKAAQRELTAKQGQFLEEHPDVRAARSRAHAAELRYQRAIDALTGKSGETAGSSDPVGPAADEPGHEELRGQLAKLDQELRVQRARRLRTKTAAGGEDVGSAQWIVALETEWARLNREVNEARDRADQLQDHEFKAKMVASSEVSGRAAQAIIVDPAFLPVRPAFADRRRIVVYGGLASIVLALLVAFAFATLDEHIYHPIDLRRLGVGAPLLVVVPASPSRGARG